MGKVVIHLELKKNQKEQVLHSYFVVRWNPCLDFDLRFCFVFFISAIVAVYCAFGMMYLEHFLFFLYSSSLNLTSKS